MLPVKLAYNVGDLVVRIDRGIPRSRGDYTIFGHFYVIKEFSDSFVAGLVSDPLDGWPVRVHDHTYEPGDWHMGACFRKLDPATDLPIASKIPVLVPDLAGAS